MSKRWALGAIFVALPCVALAQDYPNRPVSMVVAAAAGGPIDVFTRIMAEWDKWGAAIRAGGAIPK